MIPMRKPSLAIIFLTVFIALIGCALILPLLPIYSSHLGASGFVIGAIMASYSLMQFIFAPIWGRLSDRIGRKNKLHRSEEQTSELQSLAYLVCTLLLL